MSSSISGTAAGAHDWTPPSVEALAALLPQYEIEALLGAGGMGAVYLGRQASLNRKVAIKVLPETLVAAPDGQGQAFSERFQREARAMAELDHPGILSVFDFGETPAGQLFVVMEFVDGMDIGAYIRASGGTVEAEHALAIASGLLDALAYAHGKGTIHRDIRPANVLIDQRGRIKIADFGLAKRRVEGGGPNAPAQSMPLLARGVVGTSDYLAPEAFGDAAWLDHRADVYAVGVMLYQMLTGNLPRGRFELPSEVNPLLDSRFDELIARSMADDPEDRFPSADAFRRAIDAVAIRPTAEAAKSRGGAAATAGTGPLRKHAPRPSPKPGQGSPRGSGIPRKRTGLIICGLVVACLAICLGIATILDRGSAEAGDSRDIAAILRGEAQPGTVERGSPSPLPSAAAAGELGTGETAAEPMTVAIDGVSYTVWRGALVEFQLLDSPWSAEMMARLLAELDRFQSYSNDLTGINLAGESNERLVIRVDAGKPRFSFTPIDPEGVVVVGEGWIDASFPKFRDHGKVDRRLTDLCLLRIDKEINAVLAIPDPGGVRHKIAPGVKQFVGIVATDALGMDPGFPGGAVQSNQQMMAAGVAALATYDDHPQLTLPQVLANAVAADSAPKINLHRFFGGIFAEVFEAHGREEFVRRFFATALPMLQPTRSSQDACDNFFVACCMAARSDLSDYFVDRLRCPLSDSAKAQVAQMDFVAVVLNAAAVSRLVYRQEGG